MQSQAYRKPERQWSVLSSVDDGRARTTAQAAVVAAVSTAPTEPAEPTEPQQRVPATDSGRAGR